MSTKTLFTSESVFVGHPDKMADQISDAVLDACLEQDPNSRVACETLVKTGMVLVTGEITTSATIDYQKITRDTIRSIGYTDAKMGISAEHCAVLVFIDKQSPDISQGVTKGKGLHKEQGAGDQGMMFGFACNETPELMPLPILLAHKLSRKTTELREKNEITYLRPDGKCQVTIEYDGRKPVRAHTIVLSTQHSEDVAYEDLKNDIIERVIKPTASKWIDKDTIYHVNPTGRFVVGGPQGDCGLTGRKIIVDTYGGRGRHGGGAFSGKDPSKVDRSAAYAVRYIAKNIVAAGLAEECEIQVSYAIGVAEPLSINVNTFGTGKKSDEDIIKLIRSNFDMRPAGIIKMLDLKRPIYKETARYGHFGGDPKKFPWEKTDKRDVLRKSKINR